MGGFVLLAAVQHAPVSGSAGSHVFWYGVLLACLIVWILPTWASALFFVVAVLASDLLHSTVGRAHFSGSDLPALLLLGIAFVVGLSLGRLRGLRLLGEHEYRTRRGNILQISRWI